ncbi:uncharacterized protein LOC132268778 [Cornus florida]|uniref:uncharacterized protein LOC132268778 n=1 Tax=Cornus florida TaxID=4283 RepID=UPI00289C5293|nr:uncharacterized protein LOC132268778 [Cornus florida]
MGNYILYCQSHTSGKVILSDGTLHKYDTPLTVAELMLEYPQQVVVEFQSVLSDKRPSPLPADKKLEIDKVYIMLPMKRGKPATLSSEESHHLLSRASSVLKSRSLLSSSGFLPFFARICPATTRKGNKFVLNRTKDSVERSEEASIPEFFPENFELERPEYLSRQLSGKGWKPSLDTIKEKGVKRKVRHWLF